MERPSYTELMMKKRRITGQRRQRRLSAAQALTVNNDGSEGIDTPPRFVVDPETGLLKTGRETNVTRKPAGPV